MLMLINKEGLPENQEEKLAKGPDHYIFLSGFSNTNQDLSLMREDFQEQLGKEEAADGTKYEQPEVHSSIISSDFQKPDKLESIANEVYDRITIGQNVKFVAHSFGAVELSRVMRFLRGMIRGKKEISPDLLNEKVEIVLVSPFGFGAGDNNENLGVLKKVKGMLERVREKGSPLHMGVTSLALTPPKNINHETLARYLNQALPGFIGDDFLDTIDFFVTEGKGYVDRSSSVNKEEVEGRVADLDEKLQASALVEDWEQFRELLVERSQVLKAVMKNAYSGEGMTAGESNGSDKNYLVQNVLSLLKTSKGRSLLLSSFNKEAYRTFLYLRAQGMKISFVVPQLDVILPFDEVVEIFDDVDLPGDYYSKEVTEKRARDFSENSLEESPGPEEERGKIDVLGGSGHESMQMRAEAFARQIKEVFSGNRRK